MDISKAEILHLGWKSSRAKKCNYIKALENNVYYMYINKEIITIKDYNSETIFKGAIDCSDELNTLMYQLGITKI